MVSKPVNVRGGRERWWLWSLFLKCYCFTICSRVSLKGNLLFLDPLPLNIPVQDCVKPCFICRHFSCRSFVMPHILGKDRGLFWYTHKAPGLLSLICRSMRQQKLVGSHFDTASPLGFFCSTNTVPAARSDQFSVLCIKVQPYLAPLPCPLRPPSHPPVEMVLPH